MALKQRKITLGLTGGIACYKVPYLVRSLVREGAVVQVVMTEAASRFITPLTLETVSGHAVATTMFEADQFVATRHIDLAQDCDLVVIAPATANFIGKAANGIADDLLSTIFCAADKPVLFAPAMNPVMWANPAVQKNVAYLKQLGHQWVGPEEGEMACESSGVGRMSEPDQILAAIKVQLKRKKKALDGKRLLVTAGPTREAIDPVRYISNHSSGKMGYAIAAAAQRAGAEVTLLTGPSSESRPSVTRLIEFTSTSELKEIVEVEFPACEALIMAAAPADYRPARVAHSKIKKADNDLNLELEPTVDILRSIAAGKRTGQIVIGFALETEAGVANARKKLREKNLDVILLNQVGTDTGFNADTNQITVIRPRRQPDQWSMATKTEVADRIVKLLASLINQ